MSTELTSRRKADREEMARQVYDLAEKYGLTAVINHIASPAGFRQVDVALAGPHGLALTVRFNGRPAHLNMDVYVLSWHGVNDGVRLHPGMFGSVNSHHGGKATDVAHGFDQLVRILRERFGVIRNGSAFIVAG